jgi:hypothetical protein
MKTTLTSVLSCIVMAAAAQHPSIYLSARDTSAIREKVRTVPWARMAWDSLLRSIDGYVNRHATDSGWIVSRLAMYWKPGEHYTQCYVRNEVWDHGEGNAPVPTVRLPGMRVWNEYANVPLEERVPYNETGDMKAVSRRNPLGGVTVVPYRESGHLIRSNNEEILDLAGKAAFAYFVTEKEKYARFAADIFYTWLMGTYYMNPVLDPGEGSHGPGGYAPGGIMGYYDYEQIHDDLAAFAAPVYDFLFDYLVKHPSPALLQTGKSLTEVVGIVFKRFIDIGLVRGGRTGNWNVNGFAVLMPAILALDDDDRYQDGRGKSYYLNFYTTRSSVYHEALPEIMKTYNRVTGLWPESPGYALGTIGSVLDMALPVYLDGVNTIRDNPMVKKAALALFPWLDARGNIVVFGDMRGGPGNFTVFERLLTYYTWTKDRAGAALAAGALRKGLETGRYDRGKTDWKGICLNIPVLPPTGNEPVYARAAYSPLHRHLIMKNGDEPAHALMFTLYGGYDGERHLSPNGLALQLYGMGWSLAPDASGYTSYWSPDHAYHQTATGSNTILPGYAAGPIAVNAMEPCPDTASAFTSDRSLTDRFSFADVSAGEKRRWVGMVRTSPVTGYYVDIFRSALEDNDYLFHCLGSRLTLTGDNGGSFRFVPAKDLDKGYGAGYSYFRGVRKAPLTGGVHATWTIPAIKPAIHMDMWMAKGTMRSLYAVVAPYTYLNKGISPADAGVAPDSTHAVIVRQSGENGWKMPFVAVYEPSEDGRRSVRRVTPLPPDSTLAGVTVESVVPALSVQTIGQSTDHRVHRLKGGLLFKGVCMVVSSDEKGLDYLYLGKGQLLRQGGYGIAADEDVYACLEKTRTGWRYSSTAPVRLTVEGKTGSYPAGYHELLADRASPR